MDKQRLNKGFTLIEMMLVLLCLTLFPLLSLPILQKGVSLNSTMLIDDIVVNYQLKAIIDCEKQYYDKYSLGISYNRCGNVNMANTYDIDLFKHRIVVLLGTGRIYAKY